MNKINAPKDEGTVLNVGGIQVKAKEGQKLKADDWEGAATLARAQAALNVSEKKGRIRAIIDSLLAGLLPGDNSKQDRS